MRDGTTPIFKQLAASGNRAPTVTPNASAVQSTTFNLLGMPPNTGDMKNYLHDYTIRLTTVFDPDASGTAVNWDKLLKGTDSVRCSAPVLGDVYPLAHTRGAVLGHIFDVIANNYRYPSPARIQIPADTDTDVTLDLYYTVPFALEFLKKPHETAPWLPFFEGGELEHRLAASNVYDGDYAGAVTKATTTVRAWMAFRPDSDLSLHVPFQFREYTIPGNTTEFILRNIGGQSGHAGTEPGCGLAMLAWLTDATGIGLSGADGIDAISGIDIPQRGQVAIDTIEPYTVALRKLMAQSKVGPTAGIGGVVQDFSSWPLTMAAAGTEMADDQFLCLPIIMPGYDVDTSKIQRFRGDLTVNMRFGSVPSGSSRFVTLELLEYTLEQKAKLVALMGIDPDEVELKKKAALKNDPDPRKLRYVRDSIDVAGA